MTGGSRVLAKKVNDTQVHESKTVFSYLTVTQSWPGILKFSPGGGGGGVLGEFLGGDVPLEP